MTFQNKDVGVDVWFLYGSFTYGIEARMCAFDEKTLLIEVALSGSDSADDVTRFLDVLVENPRGLLRTELRIFSPGHEDEPVRLQTEHPPRLIVTPFESANSAAPHSPIDDAHAQPLPRLRFSNLEAMSERSARDWRNLVTRVWPRLGETPRK